VRPGGRVLKYLNMNVLWSAAPLAPVGAQRLPARLRACGALRIARVPSMHYRDKLGAVAGGNSARNSRPG
jgi:hypothetical protein